ncbi:MAG: alanine racemase [Pseudomonadota bacterium]
MGTGTLTIDLNAIVDNWRALDAMSPPRVATAAVVKADGYGLSARHVARKLTDAGVRQFFVAVAEEGAAVRRAVGPEPTINVFSGHMAGDAALLSRDNLIPMLNSIKQYARHLQQLPGHPFGVQLDTGMNRLGMEPEEWAVAAGDMLEKEPILMMSHLACADDPGDPMNERQLMTFRRLTDGISVPRSLAATGGILLGSHYHFDLTRPGIGIYGGAPFTTAKTVIRLSLPVIQVRTLTPGESVGYGAAWTARDHAEIATVSAGYADGFVRRLGDRAMLYSGDTPCRLAGRVSMDLLTVDVSHLDEAPDHLDLFCDAQNVERLAGAAGTINYEILTQLGGRYGRTYIGEAR